MDDVIKENNKRAISKLIARHSLKLSKSHFAQLHELCNSCTKNDVQFSVQSIDSVKGLDADICVIILTPNILYSGPHKQDSQLRYDLTDRRGTNETQTI